MMFKEIQDLTVSKLTGATAAGSKVFNSPFILPESREAPFIKVYITDASAENLANVPALYFDVKVQIELVTIEYSTADQICGEVLSLLLNDSEWVGQFKRVRSATVQHGLYPFGDDPLMQSFIVIDAGIYVAYEQ
ncbi:hypothetical protein [Zoogloea sp.]|uniref:hypothetical protein n=1 Tax=Zoogloea sp. TaxID=49181 RepID=UPI0014159251|nr:MAG: hypothetical protein F9K15_02400 [Zoogloea sp.]